MDTKTVIFIVLLTVLVIYMLCPNILENESFDPKTLDPKLYTAIDKSPFIAMPDKVTPPYHSDNNDDLIEYAGLGFNMCSPSCCSNQYPPPFPLPVDPLLADSKDEFVPSSYMCNNGWENSGCMCMTRKQSEFLGSRGKNA